MCVHVDGSAVVEACWGFFADRHYIAGVGWGESSPQAVIPFIILRREEQLSTGMHLTHERPALDLGACFV